MIADCQCECEVHCVIHVMHARTMAVLEAERLGLHIVCQRCNDGDDVEVNPFDLP